MSDSKYESLLDENTNLKRALTSTKHVLERTLNDYETLKQIHDDFKNQYEKLKRDYDDLSHRNLALIHEKKDVELQFDNTIRNFKMAIEQKQKELEEVQAKVIPSLDHDMLRIKVINEIEGPHRQALEQKQHEVDMLQGQVYELKRQVEMIGSRAENLRFEAEKDVRDLKERHKLEVNDFMQEIMMLQERIEDNRDKEIIRNLRRELDEIKYRYDETENEMEDLRREKERLREEKNDILIKLNKQIDIEKTDKRNYKAENDRLLIKVRQLENSFSNLDNKSGDYQAELERLQRDNERLYQENENKQKQVNSLNNQIRDLEDAQISAQTKLQEHISQSQLQSHEKQISEKNRIVALQREVESYQKTIVDLENKYRNTNFQTTKDLEISKQEVSRLQDQYHSTQRQLELRVEEVSKLKKDIENLHDEMYYAQRKTKELLLTKDGASPASNLVGASRTGAGAGGRDSELLREALHREEKLKAKVVHLKAKLRAANKKIMELLPYKVLGQKDTNIGGITRDVRVGGYASGSPRGLLDNLKSKYGIAEAYPGVEVASPIVGGGDVKYVSAKYGFGLGRTGDGGHNFRHDVENIRNKYGFERRTLREEERDDEILHTEIERTADEALRKYGIGPGN